MTGEPVEQVPPLVWMRSLRDTDAKPSPPQLVVLVMLALRMRKDGSGFAAQHVLAADAGVSVPTVRRALIWAQDRGWLVRTRRGHRLGNDSTIASEYVLTQPVTGDQLTYGGGPSQPFTADPLTVDLNGSEANLNRSDSDLNRSPVTPQVGVTKGSSTSSVQHQGCCPTGVGLDDHHDPDLVDDPDQYGWNLGWGPLDRFEAVQHTRDVYGSDTPSFAIAMRSYDRARRRREEL